jgi:L-alanine-DL-glutamate epimerase-like enolase superfamily enzyme
VVLLTDANTGYSVDDVRRVMPAMDELGISWLEEPFPAHDHRSYALAKTFGRTPLAAGENHYTRFEFHRLIEDGNVTILQPDLSKSGGITEVQRIASAASMWKLPLHPHSSMTGLNHAVSIHFLASIDNGGYFEADLSVANAFRDDLCSPSWEIASDGTVRPLEKPGIGVEIDETWLAAHPVIEGPGYV